MADIGASNWTEADASNTTAAPDGAPEGMAPSGVNDTMRAMMGATKRFYDWQSQKTTGGTSTAYTLSYTVAPGALVDGMVHVVVFNATNGAAATLNVNTLGAKPLLLNMGGTWQAAPAGSIPANFVTTVIFDNSSGSYRVVIPPGAPMVWVASPSAASSTDIISIPSTINHLYCEFEIKASTDATNFTLALFNASGSPDSGTHYNYTIFAWSGAGTTSVTPVGSSSTFSLGTTIDNGTVGIGGDFQISNIQSTSTSAKVNWRAGWLDSAGVNAIATTGFGYCTGTGPTTGLRFSINSGTYTGKITVIGYI